MTNKPLILGVAAALWMAGGQANATTCEDTTIGDLEALGSCTLGTKMFSDFVFTPTGIQFRRTLVDFDNSGADTSITFLPPPPPNAHFPTNGRTFGFTVSINPTARVGTTIVDYTLDVVNNHPEVTTRVDVVGDLTGPHGVTREGGFTQPFSLGDTRAVVTVAVTPNTSRLNSITNTFVSTAAAVPEPMSLSLFGLGIAGLALARRRLPEGRGRSN
jgi:hypothetical protein